MPPIDALREWAEEDKSNRAAIIIAFERGAEIEPEGIPARTTLVETGTQRNFIDALKTALGNDDKLIGLLEIALKELQHESEIKKLSRTIYQ